MFATFGPGSLYVRRTDIADATPYNIGFCNEFSYDVSAELKELHGQNIYALVTATGPAKLTAKAKAAMISGMALNAVFFAGTLTAGSKALAERETGAIPATPFKITAANGASFDRDLGVIDAATGIPYQYIAAAPATGQYMVDSSTGEYTFAAADTGKTVAYSYAYKQALVGQSQTIMNRPIGSTPTFQMDYISSLNGKVFYVRFYQCTSSKLSMGFKLSDFPMPELDISCSANDAGQVMDIGYADRG